jgi:hypothetical protein
MYFVPNTASEDDDHLIQCFYDKNYLNELIEQNYSYISGRKGMGKSALARFAKENTGYLPIDYCEHISLTSDTKTESDFRSQTERDKTLVANEILIFVLLKLVKGLLNSGIKNEYTEYWQTFLEKNGFTDIDNYSKYHETKKTSRTIIRPEIRTPIFSGSMGEKEHHYEYKEARINESIDILWEDFLKSVPKSNVFHVYLDDVDTRIDLKRDPDNVALHKLIEKIHNFNREAKRKERDVKIIMCIRTDIWNYLHGSNLNKYRSACLDVVWKEDDFIKLMGKRIAPNIDPKKAVESVFPDNIFVEPKKSIQCRNFHSNFYAYLHALSFNRARDFLHYGYISQKKISPNKPTLQEKQVNAIEGEFCAYIRKELRDEFELLCQKHGIAINNLDNFLRDLSHKRIFNYKDFRNIKKSTSLKGKISEYNLMKELWEYSVIGIVKGENSVFFYHDPELLFPDEERLKNSQYLLCLHKGLFIAYQSKMI